MKKRAKIFMTIKREMFLLSVFCFLLVSVTISAAFLALLYDNSLKSAQDSLRECNSHIVTFTEGLFRENSAILELLATNDTVIHAGYGDEESLLKIFDNVLDENENLTYAYSGYTDGSLHIRAYDTPADYNVTERPWYQEAVSSNEVGKLVYSDAATDTWLFSQCIRLIDEQGRLTGAMALDCSNESISRQLSTKYRYASQRSYIINPDGTVLIHPSEKYINRSLPSFMDRSTWASVKKGSNYAEYVLDGVNTMAYLERIPNSTFIVATSIDANEIVSPIFKSLLIMLSLMLFISLLLGVLLSRLYINRFARPIQELSGRIQNLATGKPVPRRELRTSNAEIQSIADNIEIIVKDIADREEKQKSTEYLSFHDSMTGLYNRRFFEEELGRLDTKRNYPLCILSCDVNGLKVVNDIFGHALGDRLLITVAQCLQKTMRTDDILARMGGDEFSIILLRATKEDAQLVIDRLKQKLSSDQLYPAEVSVSFGYAFKCDTNEQMEQVLHTADEMMYQKKTVESIEMKEKTVANIIHAAEKEGLVPPLDEQEQQILHYFALELSPGSEELLFESYRLRKLGRCSLLIAPECTDSALNKRDTEIGYRILSVLDSYRNVAACILHYREHWDGSGWPSGLTEMDIPLLSRIIAVTEALTEQDMTHIEEKSGIWYDPQLVEVLKNKTGFHHV